MAWGVGVHSTVGAGKIAQIDSSEAEKMPGVLAILHHGNTEKLFRAANSFEESSRPAKADRRLKTIRFTTTGSSWRWS